MRCLTYWQRRYRDDPDYRLRQLNANRRRKGLPELRDLNGVGQHLSAYARQRQRDEGGRFI
jgi:hypothetical protein